MQWDVLLLWIQFLYILDSSNQTLAHCFLHLQSLRESFCFLLSTHGLSLHTRWTTSVQEFVALWYFRSFKVAIFCCDDSFAHCWYNLNHFLFKKKRQNIEWKVCLNFCMVCIDWFQLSIEAVWYLQSVKWLYSQCLLMKYWI